MSKSEYKIQTKVKAVRTFYGKNESGIPTLVFEFKEKPDFEYSTQKLSSRIVEKNELFRLFISFLDSDNQSANEDAELFDYFAKDILKHIEVATTEKEVVKAIEEVIKHWTELFRKISRKSTNEKMIQGVIGELYYLSEVLCNEIGSERAVDSWVGCEKANQDFIFDDKKVEIKTISNNATTVKISNENQLARGMYLTIVTVSKSSKASNNAVTLRSVIHKIYSKITNPNTRDEFNQKILEGLEILPTEEQLKEFDSFAFEVIKVEDYKIEDDFPLIDFNSVPKDIVKYSFELSLSGIDAYHVHSKERALANKKLLKEREEKERIQKEAERKIKQEQNEKARIQKEAEKKVQQEQKEKKKLKEIVDKEEERKRLEKEESENRNIKDWDVF